MTDPARGGRRAGLSTFRVTLIATALMAVASPMLGQLDMIRRLEAQLLDLRFHLRPEEPQEPEVALVLIDDRSIAALGRWPWSRTRIAELVERLDAAGARAIALDLLFTEPEPSAGIAATLDELRRRLGAAPAELRPLLDRLLEGAEGDRRLAAAIAEAGKVVVPYYFTFEPVEAGPPVSEAVARTAWPDSPDRPPALAASRLLAPVEPIAEAAAAMGHVNLALDRGGAARFEYPLIGYHGFLYPSFALETARLALGLPRNAVAIADSGLQLGERTIPTDEALRVLVDYRRTPLPRLSVVDVLEGRGGDLVHDRAVIVGSAAAGLADVFVTPFTAVMPGAERHATVVQNLLAGQVLLRRDLFVLVDLAVIALGGLALAFASRRDGLLAPATALGALLALVAGGNILAFKGLGLWLELATPALALALVGAATLVHGHLRGQRERRRIRSAFAHYLHPELVERLAREPGLLRLGGEERELSVLFADIRGFTRLGERLAAEDLVAVLNAYLGTMSAVVMSERGMVDKFIGDGLIAVFGAPLDDPEHALHACRAALAMHEALEDLNPRLEGEGRPRIAIGVGINTGRMILGNVGAETRFDYTVIGDQVNVAARIEEASKEHELPILISESTFEAVRGRMQAREVGLVAVRGREQKVRVYELVGERGA